MEFPQVLVVLIEYLCELVRIQKDQYQIVQDFNLRCLIKATLELHYQKNQDITCF